ncbi:MAG: DUF2309 family protein [Planctomycetia bacterium]|nr:DUF2309 family protein [Planctomycetia bacterium]
MIEAELARCGVARADREEFVRQSLLALRGWAGMVRQFEQRPDRAPVCAVPATLGDFLAVRLVLDRVAAEWAATRLGIRRSGPAGIDLAGWRIELQDRFPSRRGPGTLARGFQLHQVAQLLGLTGREVAGLDENEVLRLEHAIGAFDSTARRRLFHLAYERRHRITVLDALAAHQGVATAPGAEPPPGQIVVCIDERCESFRRHVEELGSGYETFGTAGFFAVPMYYRGVDDWHASPLCPIVVRPTHTVVETPDDDSVDHHERHVRRRRQYGRLAGGLATGSRTLVRGGLFTAIAGGIAAVPLVARVAFPRLAARIGRSAADLARGRIATRLDLFRDGDAPPLDDGTLPGFDIGGPASPRSSPCSGTGHRAATIPTRAPTTAGPAAAARVGPTPGPSPRWPTTRGCGPGWPREGSRFQPTRGSWAACSTPARAASPGSTPNGFPPHDATTRGGCGRPAPPPSPSMPRSVVAASSRLPSPSPPGRRWPTWRPAAWTWPR